MSQVATAGRALEQRLRVKGAPEKATFAEAFISSNPDLNPVEPARRTWTALSYGGFSCLNDVEKYTDHLLLVACFWISDGVNLSSAVIVASSVADGLAWWQVWIAVWLGYGLVTVFVILAARPGAVYHIGFPVLTRASFGIWGSIYPIVNRVATATLWTAFQSYLGGECITLVLRSIWPSYYYLKNTLPASAGVTTRDFLSFFLFWLCMIPAAYCPVEKMKYLFYVKAAVVPAAFFALFGWCIADAGGLGPIVKQPATIGGSRLAWTFVLAVMQQISNFVTLILNQTDFARVARRRSDTVLPQAISLPLTFAITAFVGLIIASSSQITFQTSVFNPLDVMNLRLDQNIHASGVRAGTFFIAAAFTLGQIGVSTIKLKLTSLNIDTPVFRPTSQQTLFQPDPTSPL
jgi:NCS1 family nucleobase:cation symporter-1